MTLKADRVKLPSERGNEENTIDWNNVENCISLDDLPLPSSPPQHPQSVNKNDAKFRSFNFGVLRKGGKEDGKLSVSVKPLPNPLRIQRQPKPVVPVRSPAHDGIPTVHNRPVDDHKGRHIQVEKANSDDGDIIEWPLNLLLYTKAAPSICFSANPEVNSQTVDSITVNYCEPDDLDYFYSYVSMVRADTVEVSKTEIAPKDSSTVEGPTNSVSKSVFKKKRSKRAKKKHRKKKAKKKAKKKKRKAVLGSCEFYYSSDYTLESSYSNSDNAVVISELAINELKDYKKRRTKLTKRTIKRALKGRQLTRSRSNSRRSWFGSSLERDSRNGFSSRSRSKSHYSYSRSRSRSSCSYYSRSRSRSQSYNSSYYSRSWVSHSRSNVSYSYSPYYDRVKRWSSSSEDIPTPRKKRKLIPKISASYFDDADKGMQCEATARKVESVDRKSPCPVVRLSTVGRVTGVDHAIHRSSLPAGSGVVEVGDNVMSVEFEELGTIPLPQYPAPPPAMELCEEEPEDDKDTINYTEDQLEQYRELAMKAQEHTLKSKRREDLKENGLNDDQVDQVLATEEAVKLAEEAGPFLVPIPDLQSQLMQVPLLPTGLPTMVANPLLNFPSSPLAGMFSLGLPGASLPSLVTVPGLQAGILPLQNASLAPALPTTLGALQHLVPQISPNLIRMPTTPQFIPMSSLTTGEGHPLLGPPIQLTTAAHPQSQIIAVPPHLLQLLAAQRRLL